MTTDPAETLRRAAAVLREAAASATAGPWVENVLGSEGYDVRGPGAPARPGSRVTRRTRVALCGYEAWETDKANAAYIALVDPVIGAALADLLDAEALRTTTCRPCGRDECESTDCRAIQAALTVARSILCETGEGDG